MHADPPSRESDGPPIDFGSGHSCRSVSWLIPFCHRLSIAMFAGTVTCDDRDSGNYSCGAASELFRVSGFTEFPPSYLTGHRHELTNVGLIYLYSVMKSRGYRRAGHRLVPDCDSSFTRIRSAIDDSFFVIDKDCFQLPRGALLFPRDMAAALKIFNDIGG